MAKLLQYSVCYGALLAVAFAQSAQAAPATHTAQFVSDDLDAGLLMRGRQEIDAGFVCQHPEDASLSKAVVTLWMNIAVAKSRIDYRPNEPIVINRRLVPLILNLKINGVLFRTAKLNFYQNKQDMVFLLGDIVDPEAVFTALVKARQVEILGDQRTLSVEVGDKVKQLKTLVDDCEFFTDLEAEIVGKTDRKK